MVKTSYPTIPPEHLQSERVFQENQDSGWREFSRAKEKPIPALQSAEMGFQSFSLSGCQLFNSSNLCRPGRCYASVTATIRDDQSQCTESEEGVGRGLGSNGKGDLGDERRVIDDIIHL